MKIGQWKHAHTECLTRVCSRRSVNAAQSACLRRSVATIMRFKGAPRVPRYRFPCRQLDHCTASVNSCPFKRKIPALHHFVPSSHIAIDGMQFAFVPARSASRYTMASAVDSPMYQHDVGFEPRLFTHVSFGLRCT